MNNRRYFCANGSCGLVIWFDENEVRTSFNENQSNPDYQAYLEWLEAGNEPEVVE